VSLDGDRILSTVESSAPCRPHQIGVGRHHHRTRVLILVHDLDITIINTTGELLRDFTLHPTSDYQPTRRPKGPQPKNPEPNEGSALFRCLATSQWAAVDPPRSGERPPHPPWKDV
jgi:hypothetical protein